MTLSAWLTRRRYICGNYDCAVYDNSIDKHEHAYVWRNTLRRLILLFVALGLVAAGCGGDDGVTVDKPWARNSPRNATAGAVYMDLSSADGDRIVGASVESSIAAVVEIHETAPVEGEEPAEGEAVPMMMREVGEIAIPAGETLSLKPGSYHIMLLDVVKPLEIGQKFDVTLNFENAGEQVVEVEVREEAPES